MKANSDLDMGNFDSEVQQLKDLVVKAVQSGTPMHEAEEQILRKLLELGYCALLAMFQAAGQGDVGETVASRTGKRDLRRYPELSTRHYRSIFGDFELRRYLYGTAPSQKAQRIPFDEHFGLPPNRYSLLLENWVSQLSTSVPIAEGMEKLHAILGIRVPVDSAERIIARTGANAEHFHGDLPPVEVAAEGELLVESTDNKGIVMRYMPTEEAPPVGAPSERSGPKTDCKQMATISGCYSVDRYVRTPEDVLRALFHEPTLDDIDHQRPRPVQPRYIACMSREQAHPEDHLDGEVSAIGWLSEHVLQRRRPGQVLINLNDGELSIWSNVELVQAQNGRVDIIDVIHVIQRVWDAAKLLNAINLYKFARKHIYAILSGDVKRVIRSFRWLASHKKLSGKSAKAMETICNFLERNADRMRYNEYLAKGYPISTGFIEGACRHVIKDRMERSGMRWTVEGAQSMLYLRCVDAGKLWAEFQKLHQTRVLSIYGRKRKNFIDAFCIAA